MPHNATVAQPQTAGATIRLRRLEQGMSQTKLAARIGVDRGTVISWEKDEHQPAAENAHKLADVLGGTPEDYRPVERPPTLEEVMELLREIRARLSRLEQPPAGGEPKSRDGSWLPSARPRQP